MSRDVGGELITHLPRYRREVSPPALFSSNPHIFPGETFMNRKEARSQQGVSRTSISSRQKRNSSNCPLLLMLRSPRFLIFSVEKPGIGLGIFEMDFMRCSANGKSVDFGDVRNNKFLFLLLFSTHLPRKQDRSLGWGKRRGRGAFRRLWPLWKVSSDNTRGSHCLPSSLFQS